MFSSLLKTRLRKVSYVGGIALLAGVLGFTLTFQPAINAADGEDQYLQGLWMATLNPSTDAAQNSPCTFTADLVSTSVQGTVTCTQFQFPVGLPNGPTLGISGPTVHGSWRLTGDGEYEIYAFTTLFDTETGASAGERVASGTFTLEADSLTGTFDAKIVDAQGNVLVQIPTPAKIERRNTE